MGCMPQSSFTVSTNRIIGNRVKGKPMSHSSNCISIVVPVYHNALSLRDLLARFVDLAANNPADEFEFVFVDDGSRDESLRVLEQLLQEDPRVVVIKLSRNFGSNAAVMAGLVHTKGDAIAVIAADLQDPPELIHDMLVHWRNGSKVVLAARESRDDPWLTTVLADTFYKLFRRFAIKSMPERGFDFFLIDHQVRTLLTNIQENNAYLMGLILWLGFDPKVIHYHRQEREKRYGQSMWSIARKVKYFTDAFVAFSYAPIRAASLLGVLSAILGLMYAALIIISRILYRIEVEGWSSLMVAILILSGTQMVMMGIIGEYMWRNLEETRKRPRFVVDKVLSSAKQKDTNDEMHVTHER
jgi:polyisoprenyl-phosphate glycosyltransferase